MQVQSIASCPVHTLTNFSTLRQNCNSSLKLFGSVGQKCNSPHKFFDTVRQNCNSSHNDFDSVRQNSDPANKIFKIFGTLENSKFQNGVFAKLILDVVVICTVYL